MLILTNAMRPMMRKAMRVGLADLAARFGDRLTLRVSVDHVDPDLHDAERGPGSFAATLAGMEWLRDAGIRMTVAGRSLWGGTEAEMRAGYAALYARHRFAIDAFDPAQTVLFPEMDETADVPEITTACWDILGKSPASVMCASSRMVVRRKGAARPAVLACTLLPYAPEFELGATLAEAEGEVLSQPPPLREVLRARRRQLLGLSAAPRARPMGANARQTIASARPERCRKTPRALNSGSCRPSTGCRRPWP